MASLSSSTSADPAGLSVSASELCSSSIFSTDPRFACGVDTRTARKRKTTANSWAHAREPLNSEPSRCGRKNEKIHYCVHCVNPTYCITVSTTFRFRNHLLKDQGIEVEAHQNPIKKQRDRLIQDAFAKAGEVHAAKQLAKREETLRNAINHKALLEALIQLVTVRNLSADVCSAPNRKAFFGIYVKCVDLDAKEALQAPLSQLPGLDGSGSHGGAEQWKLLQHVLEDYNSK